MKKFVFAVAVVALYAAAGEAQDQPATPVTPVVPSTPVVTTGPVMQYGSPTVARRGLFGRLRNRNSSMMAYPSAPVMTAPVLGTPPMGTITPPLAPMPMPGTRPTSSMVVPANMVVSSGNLPPGIYTATDGTVIQIGGPTAMPMTNGAVVPATGYSPMTMQTQTQVSRRGLLGRLRNR